METTEYLGCNPLKIEIINERSVVMLFLCDVFILWSKAGIELEYPSEWPSSITYCVPEKTRTIGNAIY